VNYDPIQSYGYEYHFFKVKRKYTKFVLTLSFNNFLFLQGTNSSISESSSSPFILVSVTS